ncbi:MAG: prepilin peptidase, partial [Deltaproteobacteria bacterium]|nr:prepilin peptidase [Deltaproteobacteria bacterium]
MVDPIFVTIISILFGLVIGSFLSVCIYRIPYGREKGFGDFGQSEEERSEEEREEEGEEGEESAAKDAEEVHPEGVASPEASEIGLMSPSRSFCPECRTQLLWWHNIPLLS